MSVGLGNRNDESAFVASLFVIVPLSKWMIAKFAITFLEITL